jgi:RecA-family ATPase
MSAGDTPGGPGKSGLALWTLPAEISESEFADALLAPPCIVEDYLFADLAVLVAPGGTGKTTLTLFEAICIVLELPLFGMQIRKPGPVLIISAEDSREMLVARVRAIATAMNLTDAQKARVRRDIRISDVTGEGLKLTLVAGDVIVPALAVDEIISQARPLSPVLVTIDPAVSFGVGETRTNDAEQGLVEAARRIRRELGCCVRYVHHTGKNSAREKGLDQYAGRGGSALPDGARMVAVLQPLSDADWVKHVGSSLLPGERGMVLARPKLSYRPPAPDIYIARKGYAFTSSAGSTSTKAERLAGVCSQVLRAIEHQIALGQYPSQRSLEALDLGPSRAQLRDAVATLLAQQRIKHVELPVKPKHGPRTYLSPVAAPNDPPSPGAPT